MPEVLSQFALFGISVNTLCLQLFQRKLAQIGIDSILPQQAEMGLFARTLASQDCVVMVSYSGESSHRTPMKYLPELNEKGVPVVALTSEGDNYLRDHADAVLSILAQENLYNKIGTFSTEASINTLLDMLYAMVFARNYRRNLEFKSSSSRAVEVNRRVD